MLDWAEAANQFAEMRSLSAETTPGREPVNTQRASSVSRRRDRSRLVARAIFRAFFITVDPMAGGSDVRTVYRNPPASGTPANGSQLLARSQLLLAECTSTQLTARIDGLRWRAS